MDFVEEAEKVSDLIYCELKAGDVLFFHPNVLHRSEANLSDTARWSVISAYNLAHNIPFREKILLALHRWPWCPMKLC